MQKTGWTTADIKQCGDQTGQAMLSDEHSLGLFSQDFGHMKQSFPSAIVMPKTVTALQKIVAYADSKSLSLTIRGNGFSQGGQSLPTRCGVTLCLQHFNNISPVEENYLWVDANVTFNALLEVSLKKSLCPFVLPYNCNLSLGGIISAGGIGASSFKYGSISSQVKALEVVTTKGERLKVDNMSSLFHASLGGQGRFAVISSVCLKLKPCQKYVRTFFLSYLDKEHCLRDLALLRNVVDYIEFFCTPAVSGTKLGEGGRRPFAQWFFVIHASVEYEQNEPELADFKMDFNYWKVLHTHDEPLASYFHRHDARFTAMHQSGQWALNHLWYECFISKKVLIDTLDEILTSLPLHYANIVQLVPVAKQNPTGFFMLPEDDDIFALMILNPGLTKAALPSCIETIRVLDALLLSQGGKRYLSGFLGEKLDENYWKNHFGPLYEQWIGLKEKYDPKGIFCSLLHE